MATPSSSSPIASNTIISVGALRFIMGVASVLAPVTASNLFQLPLYQGTTLMPRLFGSREAALGALAVAACKKAPSPEEKTQIRRLLWITMLVDLTDAISSVVVLFSSETVEDSAAMMMSAGGFLTAAVGAFSIKMVDWL